MSISEKHRKLLWGRSGNRCAICRKELSLSPSSMDVETILGEECHIVSRKEKGPRHRNDFDYSKVDSYINLILLCCNDHKLIDERINEYSEEVVLRIKQKHEQWVKENLNPSPYKPIKIVRKEEDKAELLYRICDGQTLLNMLDNICSSYLSHDELENEVEVELIGGFLQEIRDYADMYDVLEPLEKTRYAFLINKMLKEIEESGFFIFGNVEKRIMEGGVLPPSDWKVLYIYVAKNNNGSIISV